MSDFFKIIFCVLCLLRSDVGFGQVSLRVFEAVPQRYFTSGHFITAVELGYQPDFKKNMVSSVRLSTSVLYLNLQPTPESYGERNQLALATIGFDNALINRYSYTIYGGSDLVSGMNSFHPLTGSVQKKAVLGGRLQLGAEYRPNKKFRMFAAMNTQAFLVGVSEENIQFWDFGIGVRYRFLKPKKTEKSN